MVLICRKAGKAPQCARDQQKDDRKRHQQDVQGDLVGGFLPGCPFDHGDHLVQKAAPNLAGNAQHQPVGKHRGATGDGAAVAAALAYDRGGFARDGAFVHRGCPFGHIAVGGDHLACLHKHVVTWFQLRGRSYDKGLALCRIRQLAGVNALARFAQAVGLSLATAFGNCFRKVGKEHRKPEYGGDCAGKGALACGGGHESPRPSQRKGSGHDGGKIYGEHDKIARLNVRGQLDERVAKGPPEHPAVARGMCSFG